MDCRGWAAFAALVVMGCGADSAAAQVVSKCLDGKGGHVYQDAPCQHGQSVRDWDASPIHVSQERRLEIETARRRHEAVVARRAASSPGRAGVAYAAGGASTSQQQTRRCEAAKAWRKAELERLGLRRTYDQLRQLNDQVNRACAR